MALYPPGGKKQLKAALPGGRPRINPETGFATAHDNQPKTFSKAFGAHTIQAMHDPPTAESMEDELRQLVEMIYGQEQAARFFCHRLYRFYVHWRVDEAIEEEIIGPLAQTLISHQFRLRPVLEQLFSSGHFFEASEGISSSANPGLSKRLTDMPFICARARPKSSFLFIEHQPSTAAG